MANYDSTYTGAQIDTALGYGNTFNTHKMAAASEVAFHQDTAPSQWTIDATLDDKLVFISKGSGAGGETGGGAHSTGTWTQPDHTLLDSELPDHTHSQTCDGRGDGANNYGAYSAEPAAYMYDGADANTGGMVSGGDGDAHNHGSAYRPAAQCFIVCAKDAY